MNNNISYSRNKYSRCSLSYYSTLSSNKDKKYNLPNELLFNKLEKINRNKNHLDFPICISILANNCSKNQNNINLDLNTNKKLKFKLKFGNIKEKEIKSRNSNYFLLSTSSKKSSFVKDNSSYYNSGSIKNKIYHLSPLISTSQKNVNNKFNISNNSTFEQDLSIISNLKTPNRSNNQKIKLSSSSFLSENFQKELNNLSNQNYLNNSNIHINIFNLYNKNNNNNNNKDTKLFNESNSKKNIRYIKLKTIKSVTNNPKSKKDIKNKNNNISNISNKANQKNIKIEVKNNILEKKEKFNEKSNKSMDKIRKKSFLCERKQKMKLSNNSLSTLNIIQKYKSVKLVFRFLKKLKPKRKDKFNLIICKKKSNEKNAFLNKLTKKISNNSLNMILFMQKNDMIKNYKEKMEKIFNNDKNKIKIEEYLKKKTFSLNEYKKNEYNNFSSNYNETKIINNNKYFYNCNLSFILKNYINSYEFNGLLKIQNKSYNIVPQPYFENNYNLNIKNLNYIHDFILKSFPFSKDNTQKKIIEKENNIVNKNFMKKFTKELIKEINNNSSSLLKLLNKNKSLHLSNIINMTNIKNNGNISKLLTKKFSKKEIKLNSPKINDFALKNYSILNKNTFFIKEKEIINNKDNQIKNSEDIDNITIYIKLIKYMMEGNNKNFINYFLKNKKYININQELYDGNNLLILSAMEGNYFITKFLCEQGIEVNNQNYKGNTALHYVFAKNFYKIFDVLKNFGARENIKNNKGLMAYECIEQKI